MLVPISKMPTPPAEKAKIADYFAATNSHADEYDDILNDAVGFFHLTEIDR